MNAARRGAARTARQARLQQQQQQQPLRQQPQRRFDSHDAHGHHGGEQHHSNIPANEGISYKFWLGLGIFPVSYFVYNASRPTESGDLTALSSTIQRFTTAKEEWERRNTAHTAAIEQAAKDRHLFHGSEGSKKIEIGFPEVFNTGSPINVPAGHYSNMDQVINHYRQENAETAEKIRGRSEPGN